jgi:signal recognition particle GTPase
VPLYERGYEKDPAKVAAEAIRVAQRDGRDVVLVDTAGRMQVRALHVVPVASVHSLLVLLAY